MTAVEAVHALVSELDDPMFIVTVAGPMERAGCLVGFATQCSIHPPRFLLCLSPHGPVLPRAGVRAAHGRAGERLDHQHRLGRRGTGATGRTRPAGRPRRGSSTSPSTWP